jgi:glycerophosphoryl diester phosphodiesterase
MPVIDLRKPGAARDGHDWLLHGHPVALEIVFDRWTPETAELFAACRAKGVRIWVNTLWPELDGGLSDDLALDDPDATYGVLLDRGVTMFQTDRPEALRSYLARRAAKSRNSSP